MRKRWFRVELSYRVGDARSHHAEMVWSTEDKAPGIAYRRWMPPPESQDHSLSIVEVASWCA